ncbi:hypothetical protein E4T52_14402 [Aureobasidium sp. EXF-3400]|nr:hypothetical protein E4T51_13439 [Aureobasidium sp. EXF-12344]KAI4770574.1 hypothetical protein E4T52_14402 [Aureobasidium sp. EXF-3400]
MKASSVQQAFKSLTSRIHPQLPLSERESQRLLNALTSSFRSHLEHHHHNHDAPAPASSASAPTQHSLSSTAATDLHLASILTNPLLSKPVHQQLKAKAKHPIALFEDQVAAGRANLPSARLCLEAFRTSLSSLPPAQVNEHITRYAAGSRALRWLWTSAQTHSLSFARDARFCNQLAYFLVREGKDAALWELIDTPVATSANLTAKEASLRKGLLLASIVKTHLSAPHSSLESALYAFFRVVDSSQSSHASVSHAGVYLTQALVKLNSFSDSEVALYDQFIDAVPRWSKKHPDRAIYRIANLALHHPTTPSADPALDFIRLQLRPLASHPFLNPTTASQKSTVFAFFFDTVKLLQKQKHFDDALWVMEFMQQKFPDQFAPPRTSSSAVPASSQDPETREPASSLSDFPEWKVPELG